MVDKKRPRITPQTLKVFAAFEGNVRVELSGAELVLKTKLLSGTLYPSLWRLEEAGWLKSRREQGDPSELGRPLRRYYKLTGAGLTIARAAMRELRNLTGSAAWA